MIARTCIVAACAFIAGMFASALPARAADEPATVAFYRSALDAMRALPQPPYVTFTEHGDPEGFGIRLFTLNHLVWLGISSRSTPSLWHIRHRTDDYSSEIVDDQMHRYVSARAFFDPTWWGAYRALRDGMLNYQSPEKPISSFATPQPTTTPELQTIAVVIGPSIYHVQDRGTAECPSGSPGRALHLYSRSHNPQHQLSDLIVDVASMRFCMIRFGVPGSFGFHGIVEQHYADVGGYWLQTDGIIDGTERAFAIAVRHGIWRYRLTDVTFPTTIPPEAFVVPSTQ